MIAALLLPALMNVSAQAATPAREPVPDAPPIIVTGKRLEDTEAALRACLARKCPPDEDIAATLAHAENLFVAGDYRKARTILRDSLGRNRKHSDRYPELVSDLFRSNALVASHLGFDEDYFSSTWGTLNALEKGTSGADGRHFGARMEIARMTARLRGLGAGQRAYEILAKDAAKAGRHDIAALARLRALGMAYRQQPTDSIRRRIQQIADLTGPENRYASQMGKLYLARLAAESGKIPEAEQLVHEVAGTGGVKAMILIYAPPYSLTVQEFETGYSNEYLASKGNPANRYGGNFDDMWIDVGFWVQGNGRVSDLQILRKSGDSSWSAPLMKSIRGRLYAPLEKPAYRTERYTYTARWEDQTGSHIKRRSPRARVEYLDLTMRDTVPPQ